MMKTLYLTLGAFGAAVAAKAAEPQDAVRAFPLDAPETLAALLDGWDFAAIAAWRPYAQAFAAMNTACHRTGTPWSLAVQNGTRLSIGPLVRPGGQGCYACYARRSGTHHRAPARELVLEAYYARNPDRGPEGFTGPMVSLAAAALKGDRSAGMAEAGRVRIVDVLSGAVTLTKVVPVHACPQCFPDRAQHVPGARFVRDLVPALNEMMP